MVLRRASAFLVPASRTASLLAANLLAANLLAASLLAAGCPILVPTVEPDPEPDPGTVEPDPEPELEGLVALHDVDAQVLPLPTDLYRAGGLLVRPPVEARSALEDAWLDALEGRDGWPRQSSVFFPLSERLAGDTPATAVRLFDLDSQRSIPVTLELEDEGVRAVPADVLEPGRTYVYALLTSAESEDGEALQPSESFRAVRSTEPLDDREQEALRQTYAPWLNALQARGVSRADVAVAGAFTTSSAPTVRFDARFRDASVPSALLVGESGTIDLGTNEDVQPLMIPGFLEYHAFSTTAPVRVGASARLDPPTALDEERLRLFRLDDNGPAEDLAVYRALFNEHTAALLPDLALAGGSDYATVVSEGATAEGDALEADLHTLALLSDDPLLDADGGSEVRILAASDGAALEPHRQGLASLRDTLRTEPAGLDGVVGLLPFSTLDAPEGIRERRQRLYDEDVSVALTDVVEATPNERGLFFVLNQVQTIVSGELTTLDWLDPATRADREEGPVPSGIDFVLTLPKNVPPGQPIPVVLFGHGLMTTRELVYIVANWLAEDGFAALAIDLPYHGNRSVCLGDGNCPGDSRCSIYGQCVDEAGDVVDIGTIQAPFFSDGPAVPPTTGVAFIDLYDMFASRDHVRQAVVDLAQAVRVIRGADWASASGGYVLDGDDIVYFGISLGGILGSSLAGVEEHISTYALNVPGAGLVDLMQESDSLGPQVEAFFDDNDLVPGTEEFLRYEADAKWALDPADPLNLAPRPGSAPRLLIQMAIGDAVVPNTATHRLSEATGVPIEAFEPGLLGHAFIGDPLLAESARARQMIRDFFADR